MKLKLHSYTAYSIGCFIVWGVLFATGLIYHIHKASHAPVYVFAGWVIGWLSATIARQYYK